MITSTFQGSLQIPMYRSPYSFPSNGFQYYCGSRNSDMPFLYQQPPTGQPAVSAQYMMQGGAVNGANGIFAGKITVLDYNAPRILTIGSGDTTNFSSTTNGLKTLGPTGTNQPIMFNNNFVFPVVNCGNSSGVTSGTAYEDSPFGFCAFGQTRSVGYIQAPSQANINTFTTTAAKFNNSTNSEYISRISIALYEETGLPFLPTFIPVGQIYGLATIAYQSPLSSNINMQVSFSLSQPQNEQAVIYAPWVGVAESWINADINAGINYYWQHQNAGSPPGVYVSNISVNYVIGTGFEPIAVTSTDQWQTDNPTLNALLANNTTFTGCPNGFIFQNTLGVFYANHSGSAYWKMQMIPGASGIPAFPTDGTIDGPNSAWFDRQGILWYTGTSAINGTVTTGTTTPLFSLALNVPFAPVPLPLVYPSLTGGCWSDCLDRIGGRPGNLNPTGN